MNLQAAKLELFRRIANIDDPKIIEKLINTVGTQKESFDVLNDPSVYEEIQLGIQELEKGNRLDYDEFVSRYL